MLGRKSLLVLGLAAIVLSLAAAVILPGRRVQSTLLDWNEGDDWPAFGRTYGEQHYSPLTEINRSNVRRLGLAWSFDLPPGNSVSGPIAVGGVVYTSTGYSVVRAIDGRTGRLLWTFDPHAPEQSGIKLRQGWGSRGLAWWNGKIYVGTHDGRLIAIDARTGREVWSRRTVAKDNGLFITGAPRVFDGKVIIGNAGADSWDARGYVTTFDAESGEQLWRFWTVPGRPGVDDDATTRMVASSWAGDWWKYGGGGTVWNSFTYDPDTDTLFLGTGNGAPWNQQLRSAGKGDNLFLCSVVALDARTGKYKWHYQFNPGETWDYNASMDMQLADLVIDGKPRKVLMEAPKNGFFYVIDRISGKLIAADKVTRVTWASHIDLKTGRPVEAPGARYPGESRFELFPSPYGAHSWLPSAYSPASKLVYLPLVEMGASYDRKGYDTGWKRPPNNTFSTGLNLGIRVPNNDGVIASSTLLAWDPVNRRQAWRVKTAGGRAAGVLATGGQLLFQGQLDGKFTAYDAGSGTILWAFDARAPVLAPPISWRIGKRQYVTVLTGVGGNAEANAQVMPLDYRTMARRVLTFALDGAATLPKGTPVRKVAADDPGFKPDAASEERGALVFGMNCISCHGVDAEAAGMAPDLRTSAIPTSAEAFTEVVRGGMLLPAGMPRFGEFSDAELADLRQYVRTRAHELKNGAREGKRPMGQTGSKKL